MQTQAWWGSGITLKYAIRTDSGQELAPTLKQDLEIVAESKFGNKQKGCLRNRDLNAGSMGEEFGVNFLLGHDL